MTVYPVPQPLRPAPSPPIVTAAVFLPAAAPPPPDELPSLVMAPLMPAGWPRF